MRLSEQLKQDHDSGDFGRALEGYHERAKMLEDLFLLCVKDLYNSNGFLNNTTAIKVHHYIHDNNNGMNNEKF